MKILIISTFFPPQNSIASLRPYSWAKYWKRAGHDITVLTTNKVKTDVHLSYDCSNFNIIALPVGIPFAKARKDLKLNTKKTQKQKQNIYSFVRLSVFGIIKKLYINFTEKTGCFHSCRYPDWHDGWAKAMIKYLNENSSLLNGVRFVISTGGPYSVHRVGFYIKKNYPNIKWIIDWRDLWSKNHNFRGLFVFRWYERLLEMRFHSTADIITTVSDGLADELSIMTTTPVHIIYNGYDPEDYQNITAIAPQSNSQLTFVYTGYIYDGYDIMPFLEAVSNLIKKHLISINDVSLIFAGSNADCIDKITMLGLKGCYHYLGYLSRGEALKLQYNADVVLFFELKKSSMKGVLSGKLFEYLVVAKEIWSIGSSVKTDADTIIEKANAGLYLGNDIEKIENAILNAFAKKRREKNMSFISQFSREVQAAKLLAIIKKYQSCEISGRL